MTFNAIKYLAALGGGVKLFWCFPFLRINYADNRLINTDHNSAILTDCFIREFYNIFYHLHKVLYWKLIGSLNAIHYCKSFNATPSFKCSLWANLHMGLSFLFRHIYFSTIYFLLFCWLAKLYLESEILPSAKYIYTTPWQMQHIWLLNYKIDCLKTLKFLWLQLWPNFGKSTIWAHLTHKIFSSQKQQ